MNVVILCDVRWFNAVAWNAVELAHALAEEGHDVVLAARHDSPPAIQARRRGVEVFDLPIEKAGPVRLARGVRALTEFARRRGVELFDAHRAEGFLAAIAASRRLDGRVAVVRTRADIRPPKSHLLNRVLHRRGADLISAAAGFMTAEYAAIGVDGERVRVIHPGVVVDRFVPGSATEAAAQLRASLPGPRGRLVGVVGRLTAVKGHAVFIDAAARLAERRPDTGFVISGEEWDVPRAGLEERAEGYGIADRVYFLDRLPDVRPLLEALDVVVVASTGSEAVSRIALEAMALARPVVATSVGSLPELLADGAGVIVPPGDPDALASALEVALADPAEAERLGRRGRAALERGYTRERAVRATVDLYNDALRRAGRGER